MKFRGLDVYVEERVVDTNIKVLRKKLNEMMELDLNCANSYHNIILNAY